MSDYGAKLEYENATDLGRAMIDVERELSQAMTFTVNHSLSGMVRGQEDMIKRFLREDLSRDVVTFIVRDRPDILARLNALAGQYKTALLPLEKP